MAWLAGEELKVFVLSELSWLAVEELMMFLCVVRQLSRSWFGEMAWLAVEELIFLCVV
jgi:hypothetical protein